MRIGKRSPSTGVRFLSPPPPKMPQPETSAAAVKTNIMRFIQWLPPHPPPDPAQHRFRAPRPFAPRATAPKPARSEEHTSELQSLMRLSYAVFCLKKKNKTTNST